MKRVKLEEKIEELLYRTSKLEERLREVLIKNEYLEREFEELKKRSVDETSYKKLLDNIQQRSESIYCQIEKVSDSIYQHISVQKNTILDELYSYISMKTKELYDFASSHDKNILDELYVHSSKQNMDRFEEIKSFKEEIWLRTFAFDNMISELQLRIVENHFEGNRFKLVSLKDTHIGEKCFVIGNGPSLVASDLEKIKVKKIFSFASKGIFNIFDSTTWRPDVWGVSDLNYIKLKEEEIRKLKGFTKLVCAQSYIKDKIEMKDVIYYPFIQSERKPKFFNKDITKGVHFYGTVTIKLINFAIYMGFKEIYLLGCDNSLPIKKNSEGLDILDFSKRMHFSNKYISDDKEKNILYGEITDIKKIMDYTNESFIEIKEICENLGVKIYNVTRGGSLEIFERKSLEEALE